MAFKGRALKGKGGRHQYKRSCQLFRNIFEHEILEMTYLFPAIPTSLGSAAWARGTQREILAKYLKYHIQLS